MADLRRSREEYGEARGERRSRWDRSSKESSRWDKSSSQRSEPSESSRHGRSHRDRSPDRSHRERSPDRSHRERSPDRSYRDRSPTNRSRSSGLTTHDEHRSEKPRDYNSTGDRDDRDHRRKFTEEASVEQQAQGPQPLSVSDHSESERLFQGFDGQAFSTSNIKDADDTGFSAHGIPHLTEYDDIDDRKQLVQLEQFEEVPASNSAPAPMMKFSGFSIGNKKDMFDSKSDANLPALKKPVAPIKMSLGIQKPKAPPAIKKTPAVANIFGEDEDSEEEEMPAAAKMRMRNIGRDTPTAAGPNSFGKGRLGFCDRQKIIQREIQKKIEDVARPKT